MISWKQTWVRYAPDEGRGLVDHVRGRVHERAQVHDALAVALRDADVADVGVARVNLLERRPVEERGEEPGCVWGGMVGDSSIDP